MIKIPGTECALSQSWHKAVHTSFTATTSRRWGDSPSFTRNQQTQFLDGSIQAVIPATMLPYPYGESYCFPDRPKERTRFSDGRLIIDFITQAFRFPFLEPYLRFFNDSAYKRGVNFAISTASATIEYAENNPPFYLEQETRDYFAFRASHTDLSYNVSLALHIIPQIGAIDYLNAYNLQMTPEEAIVAVAPRVLDAVRTALEKYYAGGARNIAIFNIPPEGCSSAILTQFAGRGPYDEFGCLINYNAANQAYNEMLNATIYEYRDRWQDALILVFDFYSAFYEVFKNAEKYGFRRDVLTKACCGCCGPYNYNPLVPCGVAQYIPDPDGGPDRWGNSSSACPDPENWVFWDGMHGTQAFYRVMAGFFLTGRFVSGTQEEFNWKQLCDLDFSLWYDNNEHDKRCDYSKSP